MAVPDPQNWLTGREMLRIVPLFDPVVEADGHSPRSGYVELYYPCFLGPAALLAARRLSAWLAASPDGFVIPAAVLARQLGLGTAPGRNAPLTRTLARLCRFGLAAVVDDAYALRLAFPSLTPRQVRRLPAHLVQAHRQLATSGTRPESASTALLASSASP